MSEQLEKVLNEVEIKAYRACICRDNAEFTEYSLERILDIAKRLFATLDAKEAELQAERGKVGEAMERLAELNLYSSGLQAHLTRIEEAVGPIVERTKEFADKEVHPDDSCILVDLGDLRKLREAVEDEKVERKCICYLNAKVAAQVSKGLHGGYVCPIHDEAVEGEG